MYHYKDRSLADRANRDPAFFFLRRFVSLRQSARIIEHECGSFEADIVLQQVLLVLGFVPFKAHGRYPAAGSMI